MRRWIRQGDDASERMTITPVNDRSNMERKKNNKLKQYGLVAHDSDHYHMKSYLFSSAFFGLAKYSHFDKSRRYGQIHEIPKEANFVLRSEENGFTQVKKKRSSRNNGSTKNFRPVLVKPKTKFHPSENQSTVEPMTALSIGKKNVSTLGNSIKTTSKTNVSTSVDKINLIEKHLMEGKCVLVDVDGKPLEKVDALGDHDNDDEVEYVDNDMARFLASNPTGVGYGAKSLMEQ
nr:hypothetical protein [Tanacetum cinerariifolium]